MNKHIFRIPSITSLFLLVVSVLLLAGVEARAQCTGVVSDLRNALGITQSNQGNLIVSETGTSALSGRISIVEPSGNRRTLLDGLPSAINDVGEPSGPAGVFMRGRSLYLAIGIGDAIEAVIGSPGVATANSNPSSPLWSSILALHFSANVEKNTTGFTLSDEHQSALAAGQRVTLGSGGEKLTVEMIANFPNSTPNPFPPGAGNVRGSNPFDLVVVGNQIYVTDGGQNSVRKVNIASGAFSTLVTFPPVTNTAGFGPPFSEAVPTGIAYDDGQLLVTLFTGFPFPAGQSRVEQVDPSTGATGPFISGLTTAIDVLPVKVGNDTDYLVLQHATAYVPPSFVAPGRVLHFETPAGPETPVAACLTRPTSMTLDEKAGTLYITELGPAPLGGPTGPSRVVSVPFAP